MAREQYQFRLDGRPAAPVRDYWHDAARDAVSAGYGSWRYHKQAVSLDDTQGAEIVRLPYQPAK